MADDDKVLQDLQTYLSQAKGRNAHVSTLARQGNDKLVQDFLTDDIKVQSTGPFAKKTQLYVASFWGIKDSVNQLLEAGTNPNLQNEETLWTPLHAAAFQEHGPVVMSLLEYGAQPELPDAYHRTPADFASASDKIWPFFAALDVPRTSRGELVEKGILRPGSGLRQQRELGHGINMAEYKPAARHGGDEGNSYLAAMSGDVLADETEPQLRVNGMNSSQPQYSIWK
ncbi:ankyrin-2 [Aplysia californica]|uniref:Ankyrin-2 n=1 Tax=Aplysia californica TaxID=6500 RepID=A0ABM0JBB4_APLCA|nr:ankyrin-2 [Aplysia californica]